MQLTVPAIIITTHSIYTEVYQVHYDNFQSAYDVVVKRDVLEEKVQQG